MDGLTRIVFTTVDMGAYESQVHLPVELVYFRAQAQKHTVDLEWQTAMEINNRGFEIQRSSNGQNWTEIGFVNGNGNITHQQDYYFQDRSPIAGLNYYRFRQMDFDGKEQLSPIVSVQLDQAEDDILIFPNPSNGIFNVQLKDQSPTERLIHLLDNQGRIIQHISLDAYQTEIQVPHLPKGMYLLQVTT